MIFTSIGVQVANARELVSEPLTFQGTWGGCLLDVLVIAIGVALLLVGVQKLSEDLHAAVDGLGKVLLLGADDLGVYRPDARAVG